jgi:hypothetical protein
VIVRLSNGTYMEISVQTQRVVGYRGVVMQTNGRVGVVVHIVWRPTRKWAYSAALKWAERIGVRETAVWRR